jgi:hypothetical protein
MLPSRPPLIASAPALRSPTVGRRWRRVIGWGLAIGGLAAVFAAYLQPSMAFELAQQIWGCF